MDTQALVVGAGPIGLTMANELCRHGLRVRILDKNATRTDKSKALAAWSRTLEIYETMSCLEAMEASGRRAHGATLHAEGKQLAHIKLDSIHSPFPWALLIPQSETERILEEHLERTYGVRVERQTELLSFSQNVDGITAQLPQERLQASWLLACDGAHSPVRKELGVEFQGTTDPSDWILADVQVEEGVFPDDEVTIFFHAQGVLAVFPFGAHETRFRVIADIGVGPHENPTLEDVQKVVDLRARPGIRISNPHWLAKFTINERKVKEYRHGRVFLAGDAAHIHSPAGGQGMNTGIQDAFNLAWKIAFVTHGRASAKILDTYSPERTAVGDMVLRNAGLLTKMGTLRNPLIQAVRNKLYSFLGGLHIFQQKAGESLGEMNIHYPKSALSREHGGTAGIRAGDRMPDGQLQQGHGTIRLHELLHNTSFNLLLVQGWDDGSLTDLAAKVAGLYPGSVRCHLIGDAGMGDPEGIVRKQLGAAHNTVYLVRPDGYVGFRGQPAEEEPLLAYLHEFLCP